MWRYGSSRSMPAWRNSGVVGTRPGDVSSRAAPPACRGRAASVTRVPGREFLHVADTLSPALPVVAGATLSSNDHPDAPSRAMLACLDGACCAALGAEFVVAQSSAMSGRGRRPDVEAGRRLAAPRPLSRPPEAAGTAVAASRRFCGDAACPGHGRVGSWVIRH